MSTVPNPAHAPVAPRSNRSSHASVRLALGLLALLVLPWTPAWAHQLSSPSVTEVEPPTVPTGARTRILVRGTNLRGQDLRVMRMNGADATAVAPPSTVLHVNPQGTELELELDATGAGVEGYYGILFRNVAGGDAALVRVVPPGPVVDVWTPSQLGVGKEYALVLHGVNLRGASVRSSNPRVVIHALDNSEDDVLTGLVSVSDEASQGATKLEVRGSDGRVARVDIDVRRPQDVTRTTEQVRFDPTTGGSIDLQEATYGLLPEGASQAGPKDLSICFTLNADHSRSWYRTVALLRNQDDKVDLHALEGMQRGETRRVRSLVMLLYGEIGVSFSYDSCSADPNEGFDLCFRAEITVEIPGVAGQTIHAQACVGFFPTSYTVELTGSGLFDFSIRYSSGTSSDCVTTTDVTPTSESGRRDLDVHMTGCCSENLVASYVGSDSYGNLFSYDAVRVGTATPGSCPAPRTHVLRISAYVPYMLGANNVRLGSASFCIAGSLGPLPINVFPLYIKSDTRRGFPIPNTADSRITQLIRSEGAATTYRNPTARLYRSFGTNVTDNPNDREFDCEGLHVVDEPSNYPGPFNSDHTDFGIRPSGDLEFFSRTASVMTGIMAMYVIDWELDLLFSESDRSYQLIGKHDGFPQFEVYLDGQPIYGFIPSSRGVEVRGVQSRMVGDGEIEVFCTGILGVDHHIVRGKAGEEGEEYGENVAPVAGSDHGTVHPGGEVLLDVLANDADPEGDAIDLADEAIAVANDPAKGIVTCEDGRFVYKARLDVQAPTSDQFTYAIADEFGAIAHGVVSIAIESDPQASAAPIAVADVARVDAAGQVRIDVLANDTDPGGRPLSIVAAAASEPSYGTVLLSAGALEYRPFIDATVQDSFLYEIGNGVRSAQGRVTVNIVQRNQPPQAIADEAVVTMDTPVSLEVVANDVDPDGDGLNLSAHEIRIPPLHGTLAWESPTTLRYAPAPGYMGGDGFEYEITDNHGGFARASVALRVERRNAAPVAEPDVAAVRSSPGQFIDVAVTANDHDPDEGDSISLLSGSLQATAGSVSYRSASTLRYVPPPSFTGTDTVRYQIHDTLGKTATGQVSVSVTRNADPSASPDALATPLGTAVSANVAANDADADGDLLAFSSSPLPVSPLHGTVTTAAGGTIIYTPQPGYRGADAFDYEVTDGFGGFARGHVTVDVFNRPPVTVPDSVETSIGRAVTRDVTLNDGDPDGHSVQLTTHALSALHGSAVRSSPYAISYTPFAGWVGTETIQYRVTDSIDTSTGILTVVVQNSAPTAANDSASTFRGTPVAISVLANDADADGDTLALGASPIVSAPFSGTAVRTSASVLTYTPVAGFSGAVTFRYEVQDGRGGTAQASVSVTVVPNTPPVAVANSASITVGSILQLDVVANDYDPDGGPVVLSASPIFAAPQKGTALKVSDRVLRYTPSASASGTDSLQYEIVDAQAGTARATLTIQINRPPVAVNDASSATQGAVHTITVTANDSDPDGDGVSLSTSGTIVDGPSHGTATRYSSSTIRYVPLAGYTGTDSFTYSLTDGKGGIAYGVVDIVVH